MGYRINGNDTKMHIKTFELKCGGHIFIRYDNISYMHIKLFHTPKKTLCNISLFSITILNVTCFCEIYQIIFSHLAMTRFPSDNLWCHVLYGATERVRPLFLHMDKAYQHDNMDTMR